MRKILLLLPLFSLCIAINASEKDRDQLLNNFAKTLINDDLEKIGLYLFSDDIDPNGRTPIGTPFIQFLSSQKALQIFYVHGLNPQTLQNAIESFRKEPNLLSSNSTAALLISLKDPHLKEIPQESLRILSQLFAFVCHDNPFESSRDQREYRWYRDALTNIVIELAQRKYIHQHQQDAEDAQKLAALSKLE